MANIETKTIIVTGLETETFTYKSGNRAGQTGRMYKIEANDGRVYKTSDREFYDARRVGEELEINFNTQSREWRGKTYTDYYIARESGSGPSTQSQPAQTSEEVMNALRQLYKHVDEVKEEILKKIQDLSAQIELTVGEAEVPMPETPEEEAEEEKEEELETDEEAKSSDTPF